MMTKKRKIVVVLTNYDKPLKEGGTGTGWYVPEVAHPWKVFKDNGVEMTFASINGGLSKPDVGSYV